MYKVTYKQQVITSPTVIEADGFACIAFENIGTETASIDGFAPLPIDSKIVRAFNETPDIVINNNFRVLFGNSGGVKKVLVTLSYYTKL